MNSLNLIHVDDCPTLQSMVALFLGGIARLELSAVSSLSEFEQILKKQGCDIAVLDGMFYNRPSGEYGFFLPEAFDLARTYKVQAIYVLSGESLLDIRSGLGPERIPEAIFQKGYPEVGALGIGDITTEIAERSKMIFET